MSRVLPFGKERPHLQPDSRTSTRAAVLLGLDFNAPDGRVPDGMVREE